MPGCLALRYVIYVADEVLHGDSICYRVLHLLEVYLYFGHVKSRMQILGGAPSFIYVRMRAWLDRRRKWARLAKPLRVM
jgi:hypothetical protein